MGNIERRTAGNKFTFRVEPELKAEFAAAAEAENQPVSLVLRRFMSDYVASKKRKEFAVEARRQSKAIARSPDELKVMDWISDVAAL